MPTVWIVNEGGHSYEMAKAFGNPVFLTRGKVNPFRPDRLSQVLAEKLKNAEEDDYLLLSGGPMVNALAMTLWFVVFGKCETLQWSHKYKRYELKTVRRDALCGLMQVAASRGDLPIHVEEAK